MKRAILDFTIVLFAALIGLQGCGFNVQKKSSDEVLLDRLTDFTAEISKRNFSKALTYLTEEEKARLTDASGNVPEELKERLMAMPFHKLILSGKIKLIEEEKLTGIYDNLPMIEKGSPVKLDPKDFVVEVQDEFSENKPAPQTVRLEKAAMELFQSIESMDWEAAMSQIHPTEKAMLQNNSGEMAEDTPGRLSKINKENWEALTLVEDKITGLSLLLPPPVSRLEKIAEEFFSAIKNEQWNYAMSFLVSGERKSFCDNNGKILPQAKEKLQKLAEDADLEKLQVYNGKLTGVVALTQKPSI